MNDFYLYILVRNDLASMNGGKAIAHGTHAGHQFMARMERIRTRTFDEKEQEWVHQYAHWKTSALDFGTTISLAVNVAQLRHAILCATSLGFCAGLTHDPTYPVRDGEVTHLIPLDTAGYIFMDKTDQTGRALVANFPLWV